MTIDLLRNIVRFFLLIALQILILNNIRLGGYINPYLYVMFILMLPFETPKWMVLCLSFLTGLTVDIFADSAGMHAAACTFMGYCRTIVLKIIKPRDGYEFNSSPSITDMGPAWFFTYAAILVFLHHLVYFFIEIFRLNEFFSVLIRVVLSSIFTLVLIIITQLLFIRKKEVQIR
jgi:cell shape-determining protein MreD